MKKFAFILLLGALLASCAGQKDSYTINGRITGVDSGMVYLQKFDVSEWVKVDSARILKGAFTFQGKMNMPEMWIITFKQKQVFVPVFVENSKIDVRSLPTAPINRPSQGPPPMTCTRCSRNRPTA